MKPNYFELLYTSYIKAHPCKFKQNCQKEVTEIWNGIKKADDVSDQVNRLLKGYQATAKTKKGSMLSYWVRQELNVKQHDISSVQKPSGVRNVDCTHISLQELVPGKEQPVSTDNELGENHSESSISQRTRPAEAKADEELQKVDAQLATLLTLRNTGLWTDEMKKKSLMLEETRKRLQLQQKIHHLRHDRSYKVTTRIKKLDRSYHQRVQLLLRNLRSTKENSPGDQI